ncbi:response regulator [Pseudomonas oryzihabitans]|uniref:response regulator n=1 Tax=Pseudomonas oryzihabitans TaxID=47885 RepID=UPI0028601FDF|nr:response regulator [Pseudomonas psychrotolerans]MDR6679080.1 DNA-binding NtrC family response regulator [Pseudomonas psychrotolerans]
MTSPTALPYAVVIEDNALLAELLGQHLEERLGWTCVRFDNADDALVELLQRKQAPALLITDHLMPGQLRGGELAQMLIQRWPQLPLVITSGYGYEITTALPPQVIFLQKPWTLDEVDAAVRLAQARQGQI